MLSCYETPEMFADYDLTVLWHDGEQIVTTFSFLDKVILRSFISKNYNKPEQHRDMTWYCMGLLYKSKVQ